MNDELDYRRRLRDLGGPVQPQRDLWLDIAPRLAAPQTLPVRAPRRRGGLAALALAASVLAAVGVLWQVLPPSAPSATSVQAAADPAPALARVDAALKALPRPRDPRLAGAVIELDSATRELQQSLQRQPDAVFLVGLLNRTYERRMKLARLGQASS